MPQSHPHVSKRSTAVSRLAHRLESRSDSLCPICGESHFSRELEPVSLSHNGRTGQVLEQFKHCPVCGDFADGCDLEAARAARATFKRASELVVFI